MTKRYAVLGSPISHSPSPKIHNFVFASLGIDATYDRFEVAENLQGFIEGKPEYRGFSVTMPLKDQAFSLSSKLSGLALITKSVNTLIRVGDDLHGYNTDVLGIQSAIGFLPSEVAVLGSGATARSALAAFPNARKLVFARNQAKSADLAAEFAAESVASESALATEVVISTLPPGALAGLVGSKELPGTLLDVAYTNPKIEAANYVSGLLMLVHQAIAQQRLFNFGDENTPLQNEGELLEGLIELLSMAK